MFRTSTWILLIAMNATLLNAQSQEKYAIVIHGGAGGDPSQWSEDYQKKRRDGLSAALEKGVSLLAAGADALDVVEQVVQILENDETFNAGRGCVLNEAGEHELDASIMDGRDLSCGAVASVKATKNPVSLARKVMTDTRHVLLMGNGADEFGKSKGLAQADSDYFRSERQKANWQQWKEKRVDVSLHRPKPAAAGGEQLYLGTVGCVVLDQHGNLAAATSTGGMMGKRWGRVGDSPIIGAGNYADNKTCAVSGTGVGEEFIRHCIASDIAARMRYASTPLGQAAKQAVGNLPADAGGVIAVDAQGNMAMEFNTPGMSRAFANSSGNKGVHLGRDD